jgi:hypothetical protein
VTLDGENDRRERCRGTPSYSGHKGLTKGEVMAVDLEGKVAYGRVDCASNNAGIGHTLLVDGDFVSQ